MKRLKKNYGENPSNGYFSIYIHIYKIKNKNSLELQFLFRTNNLKRL